MADGFAQQFDQAEPVASQPLDLRGGMAEAAEYPLNALSPTLRLAIEAIVAIAQVPVSLAAQSVLAAASLVAQGFVNVETFIGKVIPISLFFVTIASSGDRKSTSDGLAIQPVKDREEQLGIAYEAAKHEYAIEDAAYKASVGKAKTSSKERDKIKDALAACGEPPLAPPQPLLTVDEPTGPGLLRLFAEAMPSLGLFSDEGATFLGGWSMTEENRAATGGTLSKLWDGAPIKRIRADKESGSTILYNRRLCVHLMVQPNIAGKLLGDPEVRNQGLLSRMLFAAPKSLKGTRFYVKPEEHHRKDLARFHAKLGRLLATEFNYKDPKTRALDLATVKLTPEAEARLIEFSDYCEREQGQGGAFEQIADFASKMTENATRMAATIAYFENGWKLVEQGLSLQAANAGIALMEFYASEAVRLYGTSALDDNTSNAALLIDWIRKRGYEAIGLQFLNHRGPPQTRSGPKLKAAIEILVEHKHLVPIAGGATLNLGTKPKFYVEAFTVIPLVTE